MNYLHFFIDLLNLHAVLREYAAHAETLVVDAISKLNFSNSSKI
jgi:hypothetical protein